MGLLRFILNVIWLFTAGIWLFIGYILAGIVACLLIVTIPFGLASFRIAGYVIWPFGREVIQGNVGALGMLGNVIWFIVAGLCQRWVRRPARWWAGRVRPRAG